MIEYEKFSSILAITTVIISAVSIGISIKTAKNNAKMQKEINEQNIATQLYIHRYECFTNMTSIQLKMAYSFSDGANYDNWLIAISNSTKDIRSKLISSINSSKLLFEISDEEAVKMLKAMELLTQLEQYIMKNIDNIHEISKSLAQATSFNHYIEIWNILCEKPTLMTITDLELLFNKEITEIGQILYIKLF